jgi:hypothetical protein
MRRNGDTLSAEFPGQPAAGKVEYQVKLVKGLSFINIPVEPVVLRYRGDMPAWVLILHIVVMFGAMTFSIRAGAEAFYKNKKLKGLVLWTVCLLFIGGLILGPIVQKYSFGEFWTGFPFGFDLTDNKTLIAFIGWLPAIFAIYKKKAARGWVIGAAILMFVVYMIPHSVLGSEIDYTKTNVKIKMPVR